MLGEGFLRGELGYMCRCCSRVGFGMMGCGRGCVVWVGLCAVGCGRVCECWVSSSKICGNARRRSINAGDENGSFAATETRQGAVGEDEGG